MAASRGTNGHAAMQVENGVDVPSRTTTTATTAAVGSSSATAVPTHNEVLLQCRATEIATLQALLEQGINERTSNVCLYVCGVPGTGKSASMQYILNDLCLKMARDELPKFKLVTMNAMHLTSNTQAFTEIWRQMSGDTLSLNKAKTKLNRFFRAKKMRVKRSEITCLLLFIDELDMLVSASQQTLYTLFEWLTFPNAHVVFVGVANTIDLPERMLPKIISRAGLRKFTFNPYDSDQLRTIVTAMHRQQSVRFEDIAVEICARKVANFSGDVRRAFEICNVALSLADGSSEHGRMLTADNVEAAIQRIYNSNIARVLRGFALHERVLLCCIVAEIFLMRLKETSLREVYKRYATVCVSHSLEMLSTHGQCMCVARFLDCSVLVIAKAAASRVQRARLGVTIQTHFALFIDVEDVKIAYMDNELFPIETDILRRF